MLNLIWLVEVLILYELPMQTNGYKNVFFRHPGIKVAATNTTAINARPCIHGNWWRICSITAGKSYKKACEELDWEWWKLRWEPLNLPMTRWIAYYIIQGGPKGCSMFNSLISRNRRARGGWKFSCPRAVHGCILCPSVLRKQEICEGHWTHPVSLVERHNPPQIKIFYTVFLYM